MVELIVIHPGMFCSLAMSMLTVLIWLFVCLVWNSAHCVTGVQERSRGERYCAGSSQSYTCCERSDRTRGLPLLLGHSCPIRLGEWVQYLRSHNHINTVWGFQFWFHNLSELFTPSATIENFNVVETLSENAIIVYQTHKVNWLHRGFALRCVAHLNE